MSASDRYAASSDEISMTELVATTRTELAHRSSDGVDVTLMWVHGGEGDRDDAVLVCVWDAREGAYFEIVSEPNLALDTFTTRSPTGTSARSTTVALASLREAMSEPRSRPVGA